MTYLRGELGVSYVKLSEKKIYIISAILPIIGMCIIFGACGIYPLGKNSNLASDLYYQYIDYFGWFRNVLRGEAGLTYSFSMSLGNQTVGLFAYYLSSPLNLLVYFFSREQLPLFVFLITLLKVSLCGVSFAYFAKLRFSQCKEIYIIVASLSYSLMQYNISQVTNIMWLDGVYMLPLMLAGVYQYVTKGKHLFFCFTVFLSILFNWYTAYMNCLFVVLYYLYERFLFEKNINATKFIKDFLTFSFYEFLGVLSTSFFFLPVILAMVKGKADFGTENIFEFHINGNMYDLIRGFMIGNPTSDTTRRLSLFCGYLILAFVIFYFTNKKVSVREKIISFAFFLIMFGSGVVYAIENIWNGFRRADSFFCRFGYLIIFLMIYLGIKGMNQYGNEERLNLAKIFGLLAVVFEGFYLLSSNEHKIIIFTLSILSLYLFWIICYKWKYSSGILVTIMLIELILNGVVARNGTYNTGDIKAYKDYAREQGLLVDDIKKFDTTPFYRTDETLNRELKKNGISAAFNDSMVYGFRGVANYTSTVNSDIVQFMVDMGYYDGEHYIIPYGEPNLAADSFMGIKYLMSQRRYPGYEKIESIEKRCEKDVYLNPYSLNLGMGVSSLVLDRIKDENPFEFQNKLYSSLLGEEVKLYKRLNYTSGIENGNITIKPDLIDKDGVLYGYAQTSKRELQLFIDDEYRCDYNQWLSYKTFSVGNANEDHQIRFERYNDTEENMNLVLYYLDMEIFKEAIDKLNQNKFQVSKFADGDVEGNFYSDKPGYLLLTIPYDDGWKIQVNNMKVTAQRGGNTFLVVPVEPGDNNIILQYKIPGVVPGLLISLFTILVIYLLEKRKKRWQRVMKKSDLI